MIRDFSGMTPTTPITSEATPAATISLLREACRWPVDVATAPYCGCARLFDGCSSAAINTRHIGVMLAPYAKSARACITQCASSTPNAVVPIDEYETRAWTGTGGVGNFVVAVPDQTTHPTNDRQWGFSVPYVKSVETSNVIEPAPSDAMNRAFDILTQGTPYIEPWVVTYAGGFSVDVFKRDEGAIDG